MRLEQLSALVDLPGPFLSVCLDATRADAQGAREVELRWGARQRQLRAQGAPEDALAAVGEAALAPTGHAGEVGKLLVGTGGRVVLDITLPQRPVRDESSYGPVPLLLPLIRALTCAATYGLARVDRAGADVEVFGLLGDATEREQVDGGHELLHKVPGGGWAQRRYQARVEDSWQHNATDVAHELDSVFRRHRPEVVLVSGDGQAISALLAHAGPELAAHIVRLPTGGRADGTSKAAEGHAIKEILAEHRRKDRQALVDRYAGALSRQQEAVDGLDAVADALRRGQVDELLLRDDPGSERTVWVGTAPLQVGVSAQEVKSLGVDTPTRARADEAVVWATLASGGGVTLLDADEKVPVTLTDGVGALLRWSDPSTPHAGAPSMPGHGQGPG